jgi:hypothetical protein
VVPEIGGNWEVRYFLRDVGSKFGTFVECLGVQEGIQGRSYLIGGAEIEIISAESSKQPNVVASGAGRNKLAFDLKVRVDKKKEMALNNRTVVNIGK